MKTPLLVPVVATVLAGLFLWSKRSPSKDEPILKAPATKAPGGGIAVQLPRPLDVAPSTPLEKTIARAKKLLAKAKKDVLTITNAEAAEMLAFSQTIGAYGYEYEATSLATMLRIRDSLTRPL